jgi:hypothetical protein
MESQPPPQIQGGSSTLVTLALVIHSSASVNVPIAFMSFKKLAAETAANVGH